MKVRVSDVLKTNSGCIKLDVDNIGLKWEDKYCDINIVAPVSFCGDITNIKDSLLLKGVLSFTYVTDCLRCLSTVKVSKSIDIVERYSNRGIKEEDVYIFNGDLIDLSDAFRENIILNLPMKNLCKENCKGLCAKCGTNLNISLCDCKDEDYINPDFKALGGMDFT